MSVEIIGFDEGNARLTWAGLTRAFVAGHLRPKAEIGDTFLYRGKDTLLSRSAWIDGMGIAVKSATIFPGNPAQGHPMVGGGFSLFSDIDGALEAVVDFHLVTKWKTAGDSLLAAMRLARPDSKRILIVGAGTVGRNLYAAYSAGFPDATFGIWNRTVENARLMAAEFPNMEVVEDLETGVRGADIVTSATMSSTPIIKGEWLQPGQHIDLIGAYRPDMREADDDAISRARVFVDSFDTTIGHIGEIKDPIESGVLARGDIQGDYYQMDAFTRLSNDEITLFKNGGGAHLDLMTGRYIVDAWRE